MGRGEDEVKEKIENKREKRGKEKVGIVKEGKILRVSKWNRS